MSIQEIKVSKTLRLLFYWINKVVFKIFFRIKVKGIENIPKDIGKVFAANHISFLDGFAISAALPKDEAIKQLFIAKEKYVKRFKWLAKKVGILSVGVDTLETLKQSRQSLAYGYNILIFPEGKRSKEGTLPFKKSFVNIAHSGNGLIIPIAISKSSFRFNITFLECVKPTQNVDEVAEQVRDAIMTELENG